MMRQGYVCLYIDFVSYSCFNIESALERSFDSRPICWHFKYRLPPPVNYI
jgi:hypothetical protein